jgi:hypothetical protein
MADRKAGLLVVLMVHPMVDLSAQMMVVQTVHPKAG